MKIQATEIDDKVVKEIGHFAILWNYFENEFCGNNCTPAQIKNALPNLEFDSGKMVAFRNVLNTRRKDYNQSASDYVGTGLHPQNAHRTNAYAEQYMEDFLNHQDSKTLPWGFLIIYRIRNNLMHGLKHIGDLNGQLEIFESANDVLESIRHKSCQL